MIKLSIISIGIFLSFSIHAADNGLADKIVEMKGLKGEEAAKMKRAIGKSPFASNGDQGPSNRQYSVEECRNEVLSKNLLQGGESDYKTCGHPWMAPVPGTNGAVCIDRFEFPNVPCEYPVTWVSPKEAADICAAEGKRLCDASEWESSCSGAPKEDDWIRGGNNSGRRITWAYGQERRGDLCGFGSGKTEGCDAALVAGKGVKQACGQKSWPVGSHPECVSETGVYDQHGNIAEHMNLPRNKSEAGSNGGSGVTEMKGSWFAFPKSKEERVHKDDCNWREPGWHRTDVLSDHGHSNYHLGFRCCADKK